MNQGNQANPIVTGETGSPALIQSNFDLLVPVNGAPYPWFRDNYASNPDRDCEVFDMYQEGRYGRSEFYIEKTQTMLWYLICSGK
jgi:hypothetical protein